MVSGLKMMLRCCVKGDDDSDNGDGFENLLHLKPISQLSGPGAIKTEFKVRFKV